jgi:nucleoside-diphosphate-sugar epimerase
METRDVLDSVGRRELAQACAAHPSVTARTGSQHPLWIRQEIAGDPVITNVIGTTHVADVARAVELALLWPGPGAAVLKLGTGRNHSVMDMLAAARKTATPLVEHQAPHPADVPETLASITAAEAQLGWQPRIFFPDEPDS